jgi:hypothetical protein
MASTSVRRRLAARKSRRRFGAWVRGWFAPARRAKGALEAVPFRHHRLLAESLEDRRLLAGNILIATGGVTFLPAAALTFSDNSDVTIDPSAFASAGANVDLQANNDITFQNAVSLPSGIALIAQANTAILVNASVATTGANLTLDAGSGGISDSAPGEIASNGVVTLDTSGPIGSSSNRLQFDATATPSQIIVGSVTQPTGIYLAGLGNLNLGNVSSVANNGPLDVTALGNITVLAGATLDTGTGTTSLAADTSAAGAGDDGTGTLSIGAGATVISTNTTTSAITLRGADINLSTASTTPSATITGLNDPDALAFDTSGNLFVANYHSGTVNKFAPGSTTLHFRRSSSNRRAHGSIIRRG